MISTKCSGLDETILQMTLAVGGISLGMLIIPAFFFEKKGILISCQSRSVVRPSVRAYVCPSRFL